MKIVLAFDSFKGCMTAREACQAASQGIRRACPDAEVVCLPMSDGGEGLVECLSTALPLTMHSVKVHGPLGELVTARYAMSRAGESKEDASTKEETRGTTAYMEIAEAAGLTLVPPEKRNPMLTTTYGVGEMLLDAIDNGARRIVMGIGGSATCDGGQGMIKCLKEATASIDAENNSNTTTCGKSTEPEPRTYSPRLITEGIDIIVACDVSNPLCGSRGAARIFAPQKGATPQQVELLEQQLNDFARRTAEQGIAPLELMDKPGAGAAGGLGYGLMAYLGAKLQSGIDLVLDTLNFDKQIADADVIITGEGRSDSQTLMGKVPYGILQRAKQQGIPCHILSGQIEDAETLLQAGFTSASSINDDDTRPLVEKMQADNAMFNLQRHATQLVASL